jgi:serine/threonine protein phosphatase PrpC
LGNAVLEDTIVEEDIHPVYVSEGATDTGKVRTANQDAFVQINARGVWGVADGMGGYRDGDVASRMVCEGLMSVDKTTSLEGTIDAIRQRMSEVNTKLHQASIREHDPIVSGSTVAIFLVQRTACAVVWAGDSRVYRLRHKRLTQMTTDHTWASELNLQQPNEEADHAITRAVGGEDTLLLDVRRDRVRLGDRYLLCSDGLTRELNDERIAELMGGEDLQQSAKALIDATLQAGARDNVTVVIIEAQ